MKGILLLIVYVFVLLGLFVTSFYLMSIVEPKAIKKEPKFDAEDDDTSTNSTYEKSANDQIRNESSHLTTSEYRRLYDLVAETTLTTAKPRDIDEETYNQEAVHKLLKLLKEIDFNTHFNVTLPRRAKDYRRSLNERDRAIKAEHGDVVVRIIDNISKSKIELKVGSVSAADRGTVNVTIKEKLEDQLWGATNQVIEVIVDRENVRGFDDPTANNATIIDANETKYKERNNKSGLHNFTRDPGRKNVRTNLKYGINRTETNMSSDQNDKIILNRYNNNDEFYDMLLKSSNKSDDEEPYIFVVDENSNDTIEILDDLITETTTDLNEVTATESIAYS